MKKYSRWDDVPDHLLSKTALGRIGLKPNGVPVAQVFQRLGTTWINLYDKNTAIPKRSVSDRQLAALKKARKAYEEKYRCRWCGQYSQTPVINGYCDYCRRMLEAIEEMQREGQAQFEKWHTHRDWVILDTETTGLDTGAEIIEVAVIDASGKVLFDSFVRPKNPIPEEVTEIHGITNQMVQDAPTWSVVWRELEPFLKERLILIYNAPFDIRLINQTCALWGMEEPQLHAECVMEAFRLLQGESAWISLASAKGEAIEHRALNDCRAVLHLIHECNGRL